MTAGLQSAEIRKLHRAGISKSENARRLRIGRAALTRIRPGPALKQVAALALRLAGRDRAGVRRLITEAMGQAAQQFEQTRKPARVFVEFPYQTTTGSWDRARRVVAKAEYIDGKENPRYVVTSLTAEQWAAQRLYEELYCARGDMENRIKEQFSLFADRTSAEAMRANQLRMYFSAMAYVLVCGLRRLGLQASELATAQAATIRTRLFKSARHLSGRRWRTQLLPRT